MILLEIQKEFFRRRRHRIWREEDSYGGRLPISIKNTSWWFWKREEVFKAGTFSMHGKDKEMRKQKQRGSSSESSGLVKENESSLVFGEAKNDSHV